MTTLYLVRHCQAEGNIYRRIHGVTDSLVTPLGRRQIAALAERFRDIPVDALYASNLRRTQETAGAILKYHDLPLRIEPRLHELDTGVWEDRPFGDVAHEDPQSLWRFNNDPAAWSVEGSEPYAALQRRMRETVGELVARHRGQTVVCVSHGMAIRSLLASWLDLPSSDIRSLPHGDNTAVSLVSFDDDGVPHVEYINDTAHLPEALSTFARQSWWKGGKFPDPGNVYFRPLDPERYPRTYVEYYRKTWEAVHGSLDGFCPQYYLSAAIRHTKAEPRALMTIHRPDGEAVGVIELDPQRGCFAGYGWICLCYVEEKDRRSLLGIQLIGHAVSYFRALGRSSLRLSVYEGNETARKFYESAEFAVVGEEEGTRGRLLVMEKRI